MCVYVCVGGGDTLPRGRLPPPPPPLTMFIGTRQEKLFQHPLEGHSETSNDQADHYIKMKACTVVYVWGAGGGGGQGVTLPQGRVSLSTTGKF